MLLGLFLGRRRSILGAPRKSTCGPCGRQFLCRLRVDLGLVPWKMPGGSFKWSRPGKDMGWWSQILGLDPPSRSEDLGCRGIYRKHYWKQRQAMFGVQQSGIKSYIKLGLPINQDMPWVYSVYLSLSQFIHVSYQTTEALGREAPAILPRQVFCQKWSLCFWELMGGNFAEMAKGKLFNFLSRDTPSA